MDEIRPLYTLYRDVKLSKYIIYFYKNIPISHIRVGNPTRKLNNNEEWYIDYFKQIEFKKLVFFIKIILDNLDNTYNIFTVQGENSFINFLTSTFSLTKDDELILQNLIAYVNILVFSTDIGSNKKFNDPIVVTIDEKNELHIHPGKKRTCTLEYAFLKYKTEHYVDVICYRNKLADKSNVLDSFLIDKECTLIENIDQFLNAYGYESSTDFIYDLLSKKVAVGCNDERFYLNKITEFTKEKYLAKFSKILKDVIKT